MGKLATDPIDNIRPLTIVSTADKGKWTGGRFLAFHASGIPEPMASNMLTATHHKHAWMYDPRITDHAVGVGDCPVLAAQDLGRKLEVLYGTED